MQEILECIEQTWMKSAKGQEESDYKRSPALLDSSQQKKTEYAETHSET